MVKMSWRLINYEHMVIVETHDLRHPVHSFCLRSPAAVAGILKDYDRAMIAGMSSRNDQRIHPDSHTVEYPPTSLFGAAGVFCDVYLV
jgi:hypothetical protein